MKSSRISSQLLLRQAGQATTEYIVIACGILVALAAIKFTAGAQCIKNHAGDLAACDSLVETVNSAFRASVEDVTYLINLPF